VLDAIAADHADIYQRYHYRASPTESVWRTEDGLERQAPMFQVQQWYRRHGLKVDDADKRPDDHIVLQLQFVAHVVEQAGAAGDLVAVARFLDEHPLVWVGEFAERLGARGAAPFYAALAALTAAYLDELREHLVEITGHVRPVARPFEPTRQPGGNKGELTCGDPDGRPFVPGVAPSW
jgi:TorA maturation chaperone TorD